MYPALLRGGLTPGRSCRESNLARSASLGRDAENNAPGQDLKQKRKLIPFIRIKSVMSKSREALSARALKKSVLKHELTFSCGNRDLGLVAKKQPFQQPQK
jgi:hypothetical protein